MNDEYNDEKQQGMNIPKQSIAALAVGLGGTAFIGLLMFAIMESFLFFLIVPLIILFIAAPIVGLVLGIIAIPICKRQGSKAGMSMSIIAIIVPCIILAAVLTVVIYPTILIMIFGM